MFSSSSYIFSGITTYLSSLTRVFVFLIFKCKLLSFESNTSPKSLNYKKDFN